MGKLAVSTSMDSPKSNMTFSDYEIHPAANLFPMMDDDRIGQLAEDIERRGLLEPIVRLDGKILDGRNRLLACDIAGAAPRFVDSAPVNPYAFVWSKNGDRRDVDAHLRELIRFRAIELADKHELTIGNEQTRRDRGKKISDTKLKNNNKLDDTCTSDDVHVAAKSSNRNLESPTKQRMRALYEWAVEHDPDLLSSVLERLETRPLDAYRTMQRQKRRADLDDVAALEVKKAAGVYDVIVIDPPWSISSIENDERPNHVGLSYASMSIDEIAALDIPAAEDCHVWVWTTQRFLPDAFNLIESWGLRYSCTFVWHKPGGPQPHNLPQFNCEFALYCRKGKPTFLDTKALPTCFEAPRGKHSEKPEAFYDVVRRVTAGRRLDMFNRRKIDGFDGWGSEAIES